MAMDRKQIESIAPDQASLTAATKLAKIATWSSLSKEGDLWWGECQGSGSNPYRAVVDSDVIGYKCTCPSRKFPCKHSIALMLLLVDLPDSFTESETPQWVRDWLGRRRTTASAQSSSEGKSLQAAAAEASKEVVEDPESVAKKKAASLKRHEATRAMIADAVEDVQHWVSDQLGVGLLSFVDSISERCRQIAARLVDNKAAALASRIDEMPSRVLSLPTEERYDGAIRDLSKVILLAKAWQANSANPQAARDVGSSERREEILANPDALRVSGTWEVVGEQFRTRRDGLISQSTWFLRVDVDPSEEPIFALLLDFTPSSAGRRRSSYRMGTQYTTTMVFYPSDGPLRAIADNLSVSGKKIEWPRWVTEDPLAQIQRYVNSTPWQLEYPMVLPQGRIFTGDHTGWRSENGAWLPIPLDNLKGIPKQITGTTITQMVGIWDSFRLTPLSGLTLWGKVWFS